MTLKVKFPVEGSDDEPTPSHEGGEGGEGNQGGNNGEGNEGEGNKGGEGSEHGKDGEGGKGGEGGEGTPEPISIDGLSQVEIDGSTMYISPDGNIVDDKGVQVYTKEEFDDMKSNSDILDISLVQKYSGIELVDADGKPLEFENTIQGVAKREAMIKDVFYKDGQRSALQQFFDANPVIKNVYDHYRETGAIENFKPRVEYSSITLDKDNETQLENIVLDAEIAKGNTEEKAKKLLEYYKADNKLYEEAEDAKKYLADKQKAEDDAKVKEARDSEIQQQEKLRNFLGFDIDKDGKEVIINNEGSVYNKVVSKGQIGQFKIPESGIKIAQADGTQKTYTRRDIFNYMVLSANDEGYSQAEMDEIKYMSNADNRLMRFLYNLVQGDLGKLIPQATEKKRVESIPRYTAGAVKVDNKSNTSGRNVVLKTPVD